MNEQRTYKMKRVGGREVQSKNSQWAVVGGGSKVSHLVVTTTGFTFAFDIFSKSRVSTHFWTLLPCKNPILQLATRGLDLIPKIIVVYRIRTLKPVCNTHQLKMIGAVSVATTMRSEMFFFGRIEMLNC